MLNGVAMTLAIIDVWIEKNTLVAEIYFREGDQVVMFQQERPIKLWERLVDEEALTGLYLFELTMFYGGVFYEEIRFDFG